MSSRGRASSSDDVTVAISVDTEEDNWGSYAEDGTSTKNIAHLRELQERFDRWGARPTYLVNYAPLVDRDAIEVLGALASLPGVEIGAHCHPWNTPPLGREGVPVSMMCMLSAEENRSMLRAVRSRLWKELEVAPTTFKAGRWGFGPTVASPLTDQGFSIDCSVTPCIDWSWMNGPDYFDAPHQPYRFSPTEPLRADPAGGLLELPVTIGFLSGDQLRRARAYRRLVRSPLRRLKAAGVLDRLGLLERRWLSPERSSGDTMIRLAEACVASGHSFLHLTLHSSALLPGATPFVRDERDRSRLLHSVDEFLAYCEASGFAFGTLSEAGGRLDAVL